MTSKKIIIAIIAVVVVALIGVIITNHMKKISAPIHVSAETISFDQINISWEKSNNIDRYNIYRSTGPDGPYTRVDFTYNPYYEDKGLSPNTRYYYKITQIVSFGESSFSSRATATTFPGMVNGVVAQEEDFQIALEPIINLSWHYYAEADEYNIYRSTQSGGPYTKITTTSIENYTDKGLNTDTTYYYVITQTINGKESVYSKEAIVSTSSPWSCGDGLEYGGKTYETINIGSRCWFQENLNIQNKDIDRDCPINRQCYRDNENMCTIYGAMYSFSDIACRENYEGMQGICPSGWRIPTNDDWKSVEIMAGMSAKQTEEYGLRGMNEGSKLAGEYSLWSEGVLKKDTFFGFLNLNLIPGGLRTWTFYGVGEIAGLWSSTSARNDSGCEVRGSTYRIRRINYDDKRIELSCLSDERLAYLRCVRDY